MDDVSSRHATGFCGAIGTGYYEFVPALFDDDRGAASRALGGDYDDDDDETRAPPPPSLLAREAADPRTPPVGWRLRSNVGHSLSRVKPRDPGATE